MDTVTVAIDSSFEASITLWLCLVAFDTANSDMSVPIRSRLLVRRNVCS